MISLEALESDLLHLYITVKEDVKGISGTDSYTLTIGMDGKVCSHLENSDVRH